MRRTPSRQRSYGLGGFGVLVGRQSDLALPVGCRGVGMGMGTAAVTRRRWDSGSYPSVERRSAACPQRGLYRPAPGVIEADTRNTTLQVYLAPPSQRYEDFRKRLAVYVSNADLLQCTWLVYTASMKNITLSADEELVRRCPSCWEIGRCELSRGRGV